MDQDRSFVNLAGKGIDLDKLRQGQETEFEIETEFYEKEYSNPYFDNEETLKHVNFECTIGGENSDDDEKTPFERLAVNMEDITPAGDKGVLKKILKCGTGNIIPFGALIRVHYNGYLEFSEEPFDSSRLRGKQMQITLGAGEGILGWEIALTSMKRGEISRFLISPTYAYGKMGCPPRISADSSVMFEIEVISVVDRGAADEFENFSKKERENRTFDQMLSVADSLREVGNEAFNNKQISQALKSYKKAIRSLEPCRLATEEEETSMLEMSMKLFLNSCLCCLKLNEWEKAAMYARKALQVDRKQVKAHFRLGRALLQLGEFLEARGSLLQAQRLSPGNKEIRNELQKLDENVKKFKEINQSMCEKMFTSEDKAIFSKVKTLEKSESNDEVTNGLVEYVIDKLSEFKANSNETEFPLPACLKKKETDRICSVANDLDLCMVEDKGGNLVMVKKCVN